MLTEQVFCFVLLNNEQQNNAETQKLARSSDEIDKLGQKESNLLLFFFQLPIHLLFFASFKSKLI